MITKTVCGPEFQDLGLRPNMSSRKKEQESGVRRAGNEWSEQQAGSKDEASRSPKKSLRKDRAAAGRGPAPLLVMIGNFDF